MRRTLLLDGDPSFIISAQKLFPEDMEWLATMDLNKAERLMDLMAFDMIIVRKRNEAVLRELISKHFQRRDIKIQNSLKKLVVLPRVFWRSNLKKNYFRSVELET